MILGVSGGSALGIYDLSGPASDWLAKAPRSLPLVEARLQKVLRPVEKVTETAAKVDKLTRGAATDLPQVEVKKQGLGAILFGGTQAFLEASVVVLAAVLPARPPETSSSAGRSRWCRVPRTGTGRGRSPRRSRGRSRATCTLPPGSTPPSTSFVGLAMRRLGMPNALRWGVVAAFTSSIPYLGGLIAAALIGMAALLSFDDTGVMVTVVLVFLALDTLKGYILPHLIMGRQLTLHAAMVFVALTFWWWAWGIPGALFAVPLMAILRTFSSRAEALAPLATPLEE